MTPQSWYNTTQMKLNMSEHDQKKNNWNTIDDIKIIWKPKITTPYEPPEKIEKVLKLNHKDDKTWRVCRLANQSCSENVFSESFG